MQGALWHRAARRDEARTLARAFVISAGILGLAAVFPYSPTTSRVSLVIFAAWALGVGWALRTLRARVLTWHVHTALALASVAVSVCVGMASTPTGAVLRALAYMWIATFSALFHPPKVLLRHLTWNGVGLAVGLWLADVPSPVQTWGTLTAACACIVVVLNGRVVDLRRQATTDHLTGVLTRRAFQHAAELEMARAVRTGQPLTLALLDLDDFKRINDDDGHAAGDAVLIGLAEAWRGVLRTEDVLGRFGGDEFMLALPGTDLAGARRVLRRLDSRLCGWSVGLAAWQGESMADWIAAADRDLYRAKTEPDADLGVR